MNSNIPTVNSKKVVNSKDFRVGDLIDFSENKQKGKANLYLILEITVKFDFTKLKN
jgi:hypothetical protein